MLGLSFLQVCSSAMAGDSQITTDGSTHTAETSGELLADVPYINALLFDRELPLLGGSWGAQIFVDAPLNGEPDGAQITLRRAHAWYRRSLGKDWRMKLTGDYSSLSGFELSDNYLSYSGWDQTVLTFGISDPPYSLESISQASAITFMERALPVVALSERKGGNVTILRRTEHSILNASLVLFDVNEDDLRQAGQGVVLHYAHSPIDIRNWKSLHLGASLSYRWDANEAGTRYRTRPEVGTMNDYYVDTGEVAGADKINSVALEASQVAGRFSWQSELLATRVHRGSEKAVDFWGGYVFTSWFLTDDSRKYNFGNGSYEDVKVRSSFFNGGTGAIELAFRMSLVDLTDQEVIGGREQNLSVGLNWYLNDRVRLMTNLVKVLDVDRPGNEYDGLDPLIFSMRVQLVLD